VAARRGPIRRRPADPRGRGRSCSFAPPTSPPIAILRRVWDFIPYLDNLPFAWPYHFDFTADGQKAFSVEKRFGIRDRYVVDIHDPRLDRRLVIAQAVALDALQHR